MEIYANNSTRIKSAYELGCERAYKSTLEKQDYLGDKEKSDVAFVDLNPIIHIKKQQFESGVKMIDKETITYGENPKIHWYGNFTSHSGFSKMNRTMVFGLANRGVRIKLDMEECPKHVNQATLDALYSMKNTEIEKNSPKIYGATIPLQYMHIGKKILYTMMENSGTLHKEYIDRVNSFNEIWVPTNFNKKQFIESKVNPEVKVMPLGVDIARYTDQGDTYNFGNQLKNFVFLSVFKWNPRKGWDTLLRSYLNEFSADDDTSLVLVTRIDVVHNRNKIIEDFKNICNSIDKSIEDLPHVILYDKEIPERLMPSVYRSANAFVLMSSGEGFCLPICEAAATGLPIISTYCTAMTDYLTEQNSFLVHPDSYEIAKINGTMSSLAKHCLFYENQLFPYFGGKAINQARQNMRFVYENNSEANEKAERLQNTIRNNYSWNSSIDKVYDRISKFK